MSDREELHRKWMGWVTAHLGRDARLAEIAATAATEAAELGQGFNHAAEAARIAWGEAANPSTIDRRGVEVKWENLAIIAWIPLSLAWLWPIVAVVLSRATPWDSGTKLLAWDIHDFAKAMAALDIAVIPVCAVIAIAAGHSARANIKGTDRRGGSAAMFALIFGYITLIGSPIWILGFFIAAVGFPWCAC